MVTFDEYKAKISIAQIAEDLGYKQDMSKGKLNPVFRLTDSAGNKIDEIVIRDPNSKNEHYFDRNYQGGDLITFIKNHINNFPQFQHNNQFVRLNMILGYYANIPYVPKYETYKSLPQERSFDPLRYKEVPTGINDLQYLTRERNINSKTVETFIPFIKRVRDLQGKGNFYNVAFPYTNPTDKDLKTTNYELRNYGFKGMATGGDKSDSLWIADFASSPITAKHIYFAESALDAMSYYELNKNKIRLEESVFCSVGGYISPNQIKNAIAHYPCASIHTCFDNDLNGNLYDIKVYNIIANKELQIKEDKDKGNIIFKTPTAEFSIAKDEVSLSKFREIKGAAHNFKSMTVHKAEKECKDFNEVLMKQKNKLAIKL